MNTLNLDQSKFKSISSNLLEMVKKHEGEISHSQMLQFLSQSIYNKPYEEVDKVYFSDDIKKKIVHFFKCDDTYFVFVGKKLVYQSEKFDANEVISSIQSFKGMQKWKADSFKWVDIPFTINGKGFEEYCDEFHIDSYDSLQLKPHAKDVYKTASLLGFITPNLFNALEASNTAFINELHIDCLISDDYLESVNQSGLDAIVWTPEASNQHSFYEFYFTLKDIGEAVYSEDEKLWILTQYCETSKEEKHFRIKPVTF